MISVQNDESDWDACYLKFMNKIATVTRELEPASKLSDDRNERLHEINVKIRERIINNESQADNLISRIHSIKRKIKGLNASIENYRSTKNGYMKQIESLSTSDIPTIPCEYQDTVLMQMYKSIQPFKRLLGIQIQKTHSGLLQILFHGCCCCSKSSGSENSNIVCCCQLRLENASRFELVLCNPPIPDVEKLVNHLNWTEDIRSFIIVLRQRFCRYFELAAAVSSKLDTD